MRVNNPHSVCSRQFLKHNFEVENLKDQNQIKFSTSHILIQLYCRIGSGSDQSQTGSGTTLSLPRFAYISWQVYQRDIIAKHFVDKNGKQLIIQVVPSVQEVVTHFIY